VLELLTGVAERIPLLVVAEDAHCLGRVQTTLHLLDEADTADGIRS
jgi:hypothetical protein